MLRVTDLFCVWHIVPCKQGCTTDQCLIDMLCINQFRVRTSPLGKALGIYFEVVKSPAPGKNFPAKARPPGQKTPSPGEYFRRSGQPFLLTGVEILGFCWNQTWKRIGSLSNYSLVIPSSFGLSTILKSFKVFSQLWNRFCNQRATIDGRLVCSRKVPSCGINWQLGTLIIGPTPGQPLGNSDSTNPRDSGWKYVQNPRGCPGECSRLELIDALAPNCFIKHELFNWFDTHMSSDSKVIKISNDLSTQRIVVKTT